MRTATGEAQYTRRGQGPRCARSGRSAPGSGELESTRARSVHGWGAVYTGEGLGPHVAKRAGSWSGRGCARWEVCGTLTCVSGAVRTSSGASPSPVLPVLARPWLRSSPRILSTWEVGTRATRGPREVWGVGESRCMWMKGSLVEIKGPVLSSWLSQRSPSRPQLARS